MGSAKKFLDLWFDFIMFIAGLAVLSAGIYRINKMQDAALDKVLNNALVYVTDEPKDTISGDVFLAFLLSSDVTPVTFDGVVYSLEKRAVLIPYINISKEYYVTREYRNDTTSSPSLIIVSEKKEE